MNLKTNFVLTEIFRMKFVVKLLLFFFPLSLDESERFKDGKNDIGSKNQ